MLLRPCNRHLLIKPVEENQIDESSILLPDDYKQQNPHGVALVVRIAQDCTVPILEGDTITYSTNMIENITLHGKEFFLLLENYVLGIIEESKE